MTIEFAALKTQLETIRAEKRAQRQPLYEARYGLANMSDADYALIDTAEKDLRECDSCGLKYCAKTENEYLYPRVTIVDGHPKVEWRVCKVWHDICEERCRRAGIPLKYANRTFADYEVTADNGEAVKAAQWFLRKPRDKGLYLYGGAGTGKTFLASLIAREYVNRRRGVVFGDVPLLLTELKKSFEGTGEKAGKILERYCQTSLLVLDDFGAGKITDWTVEVLYQVVNARYNEGKPLIVTSNYDLQGLGARLCRQDEFGGQRIISRLTEMCEQGFLGIKDRRETK